MNTSYKKVETIPEFIEAIRIRVEVFIIEQKCPPGWEPDELDKVSKHFIALDGKKIIATARLREDPDKDTVKIERMVVKKEYRGQGIGKSLTDFIVSFAKKTPYKKIWMQAQSKACSFYQKSGFKPVSGEYNLHNLGIKHTDMELILND